MVRSLNLYKYLKDRSMDRKLARIQRAMVAIAQHDMSVGEAMTYAVCLILEKEWKGPVPTRHVSPSTDGSIGVQVDVSSLPKHLIDEWFSALSSVRGRPNGTLEFAFAAMCDPKYRTVIVDDRREIYLHDIEKFGPFKADLFFVVDTLKAIQPLLKRVSILGVLAEAYRRVAHWFGG